MKILIKNGRIIDPKNNIDKTMDLLIENDKITMVAQNINTVADTVINAENLWVTPGFIDLHVHIREPGFEYKETIKTGTQSAATGGFTTICAMPNTKPTIDNKKILDFIKQKAIYDGVVNVLFIGSITKNQQGETLADIEEMTQSGILAISEDGRTVDNSRLFLDALQIAKNLDIVVMSHAEDKNLTGNGQMNEGIFAEKIGVQGIPKEMEEVIIARDIILNAKVAGKLHICHVSTKNSVRLIKEAKERGELVTGEVTPHHFSLSDEDIKENNGKYKMAPPLRGKEDINAILVGLQNGTIQAIATDHAPHDESEKNCKMEQALNGIVGLETALPLCITNLVNKNVLSPISLIAKLTCNPAEIIGIDKGSLGIDKIADITIIDPNAVYKINSNDFKSKSKNTPFDGFEVMGKVKFTIVSGKIVYSDSEVIL